MVHAIVLITAEPARIAALASDIADLDGVSAAYSVAGDEDIVVVIRVSDHESLADLVTGSIAAQPGVLRTRTLIAFRVYSQADLESIEPDEPSWSKASANSSAVSDRPSAT